MTSRDTEGRPSGWRLFHFQYSRNPLRCQAMTVSGLTMTCASPKLEAHLKSTRCKEGCVTCYMDPAGAVMGQRKFSVGTAAAGATPRKLPPGGGNAGRRTEAR